MEKKEIINIIRNRCSEAEREAFFTKLSENPELQAMYEKVKAEYVMDNLPYSAMGGIRSYEQTRGELSEKISRRNRFHMVLYRIAAILVIPMALLLGYNYLSDDTSDKGNDVVAERILPQQQNPTMKYYADLGVKGFVNLPDGSRVWLNSGSSIEFPAKFDSLSRDVAIQGEGYFDVVSNKSWPFMVKTPKGITAVVTGTQFNLTCYQEDDQFRLTLLSGSLYLKRDNGKSDILVSPNQEVVIKDAEKPLEKPKVVNQNNEYVRSTTVWKDGKLVFDNTPMTEVVNRIERWYGVSIKVEDQSIYADSYTAQFDTESIVQVLEVLKVTLNIQYSISGKSVTLY